MLLSCLSKPNNSHKGCSNKSSVSVWTSLISEIMSQSSPTGYIPPGNPRGLAQKTCPGGRDLTFEICPGDREFDKDQDFVENESETSKKIAWIKFLQVKTKTS